MAGSDTTGNAAGTVNVPSRRPFAALAVLCAAPFLGVFDTSVVAIALPAMRRELGFSEAGAQWVLNAYALAHGGLLLLGGRLADLLGRRRVFMAGLGLFGIASLSGGLAGSPAMLVAARALQGLGAAALVPSSLALVTTGLSEPARRDRAVGIYGAMAGVGFIAGIVAGGLLTEVLGWRSVLLVTAPLALAAVLVTPHVVPESHAPNRDGGFDLLGAATVTGGAASLIVAMAGAAERGWVSPITAGWALLGTALLSGFVAVERRAVSPLLPLTVFRARSVTVANLAVGAKSVVGLGQLYVLTLYFQDVLGHGPLRAAFLFVPMTLASVAGATVAGVAVARTGVRVPAATGLALVATGLLLVVWAMGEDDLAPVLIGTIVAELGFMSASVALTLAATVGVPAERRGMAAGILNTSNQLGNALGLGLAAALVSGGGARSATTLVDGLRSALIIFAAIVATASVLVLATLRPTVGQRPASGTSHGAQPKEIP